MHRRRKGIWGLIIAIVPLLLSGGGCSWHRTGQGWILQSGWSLEFKRMPFSCCRATECTENCAVCADKEPGCSSPIDGETAILHKGNPKDLEKLNNSPLARLLERHGRLGICASCGHLARFKEPEAAEQTPPQVIAKFHPVPTQPVFCPRDETLQTAPYNSISQQKQRETSTPPKKLQSKASMPVDIPAPPVVSDIDKSTETVPRQLDVTREPSSWIFSPSPETKAAPLTEAQLPPPPSERAARR